MLELTSPHREGEYYRYGSEIGTTGRPVRVWSSYNFRGKSKLRERDMEEEEVLDFASAIHMLRRERPAQVRYLRLWSDGREYPLTVSPSDEELVDCGGRSWTTRRYVIEGRKVEGEKFWKGRFSIWIADDDEATPVRIVGEKGLLTVRLELTEANRWTQRLPAVRGEDPAVPDRRERMRPGLPFGDLARLSGLDVASPQLVVEQGDGVPDRP